MAHDLISNSAVKVSFNDLMLRLMMKISGQRLQELQKFIKVRAYQGTFRGSRSHEIEENSIAFFPSSLEVRLYNGKPGHATWEVLPGKGTLQVTELYVRQGSEIILFVLPNIIPQQIELETFPGMIQNYWSGR